MNASMLPSTVSPSSLPSAKRLRADVESICFKKGRKIGSKGHARARKVLTKRLGEIGCAPYRGDSFELPYRRNGISFCRRKMERIARQVCSLFVSLDFQSLERSGGKERVCDTLDLEARAMRRAFGPLWRLMLKRAGVAGIRGRKDMDRLVGSILAAGL